MRESSSGVGAIDTGQLVAGHYRLVEHIGSGATGVVWRAIDERLERSVAVKQIVTQHGLSDTERSTVRQRAMREAKNAARFQHPNAIVVFDIAEFDGDPCLVMEYLPSRSLAAVLSAQGTLPLAQVARIGEQVAAALVAAHRAGIVHRDIKPGNILLDENGTAKITDFGISRATGDLTLTETGLICGTPAYLAPEVARGADPTPASDVFSLGATLYQALEGQPPYGTNTNQLALLYSAANGRIIAPTSAGPATELLESMLSIDPDQRPSMSAARARLAGLAVANPGPPMTLTLPSESGSSAASGSPVPQAQTPPTPPREPTAALSPAASGGAAKAPLNRRTVVLSSAAAVVLVVLAAIFLTLDLSNSKGSSSASQQHTATATPSLAPSSDDASSTDQTTTTTSKPSGSGASVSAAALGATPSSGKVEWGDAGNVVSNFYGNPAGSWDLLTPAAQAVYGSRQAFQQYWTSHPIDSFSGISSARGANNADGSVDMVLESLVYGGQSKSLTLRVTEYDGRLLIDSDTR
jgi:serine/threonine protein kinase